MISLLGEFKDGVVDEALEGLAFFVNELEVDGHAPGWLDVGNG